MTDDYNPLTNADRYKSRIDMSVIGPMKKFDPLPIPFQSVPIKSVPIETESEKIGTRLIGIGIGVTRYLDAFPYLYSLCPLLFILFSLKKYFSSGPPCIFLI